MQTTQTTTRLGLVVVFNRRLGLRVPTLTAGAPGWPPAGRLSLTCLAVLAAVALVRPVLAAAALVQPGLEPGPVGVLWGVLAAATAAWVLYPQPQTGFRRLGLCPVGDVAAGDWIDDGWWARQVASRIPAPAGSGRRWRLTFAEGSPVDMTEGERVERLEPVGEVTTASCPLAIRVRSAVAVVLLLWAPPLALPARRAAGARPVLRRVRRGGDMPARSQGSIAPQVAAAARWWGPTTSAAGNRPRATAATTLTAMSEVGGRPPPLPAELVDRFEAVLAEVLQREYRAWDGWVGMQLEYWPHPLLEQAAERAGIDLALRLPFKTTMTVLPYGVWVQGPTTGYDRVWLHGGPDGEPDGEPAGVWRPRSRWRRLMPRRFRRPERIRND